MLKIHDESVRRSDAFWLVDQLRIVGRADDATAAAAIERALMDEAPAVPLAERERDAVLACLEDPPEGLLELRRTLLRDNEL